MNNRELMELGDRETVSVNKERSVERGTRKTGLCIVCRQGVLREEDLFRRGSETRIKNTEIKQEFEGASFQRQREGTRSRAYPLTQKEGQCEQRSLRINSVEGICFLYE